jgi:hypothetical protein
MTDMRLRATGPAAVGIMLVVLCGSGLAATQLQLKLAKGKTYYQKTIVDQQITQTLMGQQQKIEQGTGTGLKLQVLDVDAQGNMRIQYTYLWTRFKQANAMARLDYDSARKSAAVPAGAEGFAALIGQSYTVTLTPKGKVLDVNGVEQLKQAVLEKLPAGADAGPMAVAMASYMDKDSLKQMTEAGTDIYPDKPVSPGDSWNKDMTVAIGFPVIIQSKWTLQKEEAGVATITLTSTLRPDPSAPPMDTGGMKLNCNLSGTQEGTLQVAEVTGLLTASKARQQLKGDVKVAASAGAPPAMAIPMTIDTQITGEMSDQMWKTGPQ